MWWDVLILVLVACFGGVLMVGAPYLPTLRPQVKIALELARLKPGKTLLELGCGDGKVLLAAAKQGLNVVGYELNPILVVIARLRTWKYRRQVRVIWGNFWTQAWPPADAVFVFLLPKYMEKLNTKLLQYPHKPIRLVSYAFKIPSRKAGRRKGGVYLYTYRK